MDKYLKYIILREREEKREKKTTKINLVEQLKCFFFLQIYILIREKIEKKNVMINIKIILLPNFIIKQQEKKTRKILIQLKEIGGKKSINLFETTLSITKTTKKRKKVS